MIPQYVHLIYIYLVPPPPWPPPVTLQPSISTTAWPPSTILPPIRPPRRPTHTSIPSALCRRHSASPSYGHPSSHRSTESRTTCLKAPRVPPGFRSLHPPEEFTFQAVRGHPVLSPSRSRCRVTRLSGSRTLRSSKAKRIRRLAAVRSPPPPMKPPPPPTVEPPPPPVVPPRPPVAPSSPPVEPPPPPIEPPPPTVVPPPPPIEPPPLTVEPPPPPVVPPQPPVTPSSPSAEPRPPPMEPPPPLELTHIQLAPRRCSFLSAKRCPAFLYRLPSWVDDFLTILTNWLEDRDNDFADDCVHRFKLKHQSYKPPPIPPWPPVTLHYLHLSVEDKIRAFHRSNFQTNIHMLCCRLHVFDSVFTVPRLCKLLLLSGKQGFSSVPPTCASPFRMFLGVGYIGRLVFDHACLGEITTNFDSSNFDSLMWVCLFGSWFLCVFSLLVSPPGSTYRLLDMASLLVYANCAGFLLAVLIKVTPLVSPLIKLVAESDFTTSTASLPWFGIPMSFVCWMIGFCRCCFISAVCFEFLYFLALDIYLTCFGNLVLKPLISTDLMSAINSVVSSLVVCV